MKAGERRPQGSILIVDDEQSVLESVRRRLRISGFADVITCSDARDVPAILDRHDITLIILDLIMPHMRGEKVLELVSERHPGVPVIVVTAEPEVSSVVTCMRMGAVDYITKPVDSNLLVATVEKALENSAIRTEAERLREGFFAKSVQRPEAFREIITADPAMVRLFAYVEAVAPGSNPVLITGETGTGKGLVGRALHATSGREGPFVAVSVGGLDDTMFSDTLFGHAPGAFTGAEGHRSGLVEKAAGGTLFLDEIGDLSEAAQVKLLRMLQEREYYPLGSDVAKDVRARIVAATHRPAAALRKDLYFRLRGYEIRVPPLRERPEDLPLLVEHFVTAAAQDLGLREPPRVPGDVIPLLAGHDFPGNVRELQSMVFAAVAERSADGISTRSFADLMESVRSDPAAGPSGADRGYGAGVRARTSVLGEGEMRRLERENILNALWRANWRIKGRGGAAELLGIRPSTLTSRMKKHGIVRPRARTESARPGIDRDGPPSSWDKTGGGFRQSPRTQEPVIHHSRDDSPWETEFPRGLD